MTHKPLDVTKPLYLNDGTPVEVIHIGLNHITVRVPDKYRPHPARRHYGSDSHTVQAHRQSAVLLHNYAHWLTNEVPMTKSTRIMYGFPTSTGAPYSSQQEASTAFLRLCPAGYEDTILKFTQESPREGGAWKTVAVEVLPVLRPPVIKCFDMAMNDISKSAPSTLASQSHVRIEMVGGIVAKAEIVHPS